MTAPAAPDDEHHGEVAGVGDLAATAAKNEMHNPVHEVVDQVHDGAPNDELVDDELVDEGERAGYEEGVVVTIADAAIEEKAVEEKAVEEKAPENVVVHGGGDGEGELVLSAGARARIRDGVPANTRRAYAGAWSRFTTWCEDRGRRALPTSAETLAEYLSHLADQGRARATSAQAIAAIRTAHTAAGHPPPETTAANLVLRAATREQTRTGRRARQAPPVTVPVLHAMIEVLDLDTVAGRRDHALLVLGFTAFARRSEIAGWNIEDLVETEHGLEAWIREAKTDHTGEGQRADLPRGAHPDTDPVTVARRWLDTLAEHGITTGPLLRTVDRHGHLGGRLSGDAVSAIVHRVAVRAEVPRADEYTGHSLRAGAATAAFTAGAPIAGVTRAGRWADGSTAVGRYHRGVDRWRDHPLRGVGL